MENHGHKLQLFFMKECNFMYISQCFLPNVDGNAVFCSNDSVPRFLCRIGPQFNTSEWKSQLLFRIKLLKLGWFYINTKNLCSLLGWFTISAIHEQWKFCLLTGLKLFSCAIAPSISKLSAAVVFAHRFQSDLKPVAC